MTFDELYIRLCTAALVGDLDLVKTQIDKGESHNMDCLLNAKNYAPIINIDKTPCDCEEHKCISACLFDAIEVTDGAMTIDALKCVGCNACAESCDSKKLTAGKELIDVIMKLKSADAPVYALVAPAITGQFGDGADIGKLRSALKDLGFAGVVEVATFADILTLKEALEFSHMADKGGYQLTSCCCPVWIAMIKKIFNKLSDHLSPSVSPMIAAGRCVKLLNDKAVTVFMSPCLAKRAEAKEPDVVGAIDYVLTFRELKDLFDFTETNVEEYTSEDKEHASYAGRIYAKTGGVSDAVAKTYNRIMEEGESHDTLISRQANGIPECKAMLNDIVEGRITANFYEGMGCVGGCIGGVKTCRNMTETRKLVEKYAEISNYETPIDNPFVVKILSDLGFNKIGDLLSDKELFSRKIN